MSIKRKLEETPIYSESHSSIKKRKYEKNDFFNHPQDQKQFESILNFITECEIIKSCNIPSVITTSIAQYATGNIYQCSSEKCNQEIFIMFENLEKDKNKKYATITDKQTTEKLLIYCHSCIDEKDIVQCIECQQAIFANNSTMIDDDSDYGDDEGHICDQCKQCFKCGGSYWKCMCFK